MTDNEIIKALNEADGLEHICINCMDNKGKSTTVKVIDIVDLINHQQAEIERLQSRLKKERHQFADLGKMYSEIRAEAIKEFAERLKEKNGIYNSFAIEYIIDNLVKEMVGDDKCV